MDLFETALEIFKERRFINYDKILPLYICSIGCHMFNYLNKTKKEPMFTSGGLIPDMRAHIFMVTIPGFGKTYTIEQFISDKMGVLSQSEVKTGRIAEVSAAGLVGSIKTTQDGSTITDKGALQRKKEYILCSDEFSMITNSAKQQHSKTLTSVLLTALDGGNVTKDLVGGGIEFVTYSTIWGAVQPAVYELGQGLPRRFLFVVYMPDYHDFMKFRQAADESDNVRTDLRKLLQFKRGVNERFIEIKDKLKHIEFDESFSKWLKQFMLPHYEETLFKRILLGYWIMKLDELPETLVLKLNDEVEDLIRREMKWRLTVQKGVKKIRINEIIRHIEKIEYDNLIKMLLSFSLEYTTIERELMVLESHKFIKISEDRKWVYNLKYKVNGDASKVT